MIAFKIVLIPMCFYVLSMCSQDASSLTSQRVFVSAMLVDDVEVDRKHL